VFHAAMVLDDETIANLDEPRFIAVQSPKMLGAWNLHTATLDLPLEHFVCFSSYSTVIGVPKQANYNAGNAFLDALTQYRRARRLPALTINWEPIVGAGLVERNRKTAEFLEKVGASAFNLTEALRVLEGLMVRDPGLLAVARADWRTMGRAFSMVG